MRLDKIALILAAAAMVGVLYLWSYAPPPAEHIHTSAAAGVAEPAPVRDVIAPKISGESKVGDVDTDIADDSTEQIERLLERVATLESRLAELSSERRDTPGLDAEEIRAREANLAVDEERIFEENYRRLDDQFVSEALDEAWSGTMTADLQLAASKSEALREAFTSIECRATLCRIDVEPGENGRVSLQDLHKALPGLSELAPTAVTFANPDGSSVFFLVRAGHDIPGE